MFRSRWSLNLHPLISKALPFLKVFLSCFKKSHYLYALHYPILKLLFEYFPHRFCPFAGRYSVSAFYSLIIPFFYEHFWISIRTLLVFCQFKKLLIRFISFHLGHWVQSLPTWSKLLTCYYFLEYSSLLFWFCSTHLVYLQREALLIKKRSYFHISCLITLYVLKLHFFFELKEHLHQNRIIILVSNSHN